MYTRVQSMLRNGLHSVAYFEQECPSPVWTCVKSCSEAVHAVALCPEKNAQTPKRGNGKEDRNRARGVFQGRRTSWSAGIYIYIYIYIYIPGTQMTSIFEGQPPKTRSFPIKTRVLCRYHPWHTFPPPPLHL